MIPSPYLFCFLFVNILQYCHFKLMFTSILVLLLFKFLDDLLEFVEFMVIIAVGCGSLNKTPPMADFGLKYHILFPCDEIRLGKSMSFPL